MNRSFKLLFLTPFLTSSLLVPRLASAQPVGFPVAAAGCPMAHCDARMSDAVDSVSPSIGALVAIDAGTAGGTGGLGCVSNTQRVACTGHGGSPDNPSLVVFDADGHRLWDDGGLLGTTAWMSAPIIGSDGTVIATDQNWIMRVDPATGTIFWKSHKPDSGDPISPVLVGDDSSMVLLATDAGSNGVLAELSVWDAATGALLAHQAIVDPDTGRSYSTQNTPAARGSSAYVLTAADVDATDGRLYAVDVCNGTVCGGRGTIKLRWHYDFSGPSGASPLMIGSRIYFDGRPGGRTGTFMAVADDGATPRLVWRRLFASKFTANAAQDPRGGLWCHPQQSQSLLRLNEDTGAIDQQVVASTATGLSSAYSPASVISVSRSKAGAVALTFGVVAWNRSDLPSYVTAVDVSSTPAGAALWTYEVAPNAASNSAGGQYPIVVGSNGGRRIVFQGTSSGTFFVGEP